MRITMTKNDEKIYNEIKELLKINSNLIHLYVSKKRIIKKVDTTIIIDGKIKYTPFLQTNNEYYTLFNNAYVGVKNTIENVLIKLDNPSLIYITTIESYIIYDFHKFAKKYVYLQKIVNQ